MTVQRRAPPDVVRALQRGIAMYEQGLGGDGLEQRTVEWARKLVAGEEISGRKISMMLRWFGRNRRFGNRGTSEAQKTAWYLWGGAAGERWAKALMATEQNAQIEETNAGAGADSALSHEPALPKRLIRELAEITRFMEKAPDIRIEGIDIDTLTQGDDDPVFITLRLAQVGRVSKNGLLYDEELVREIERQLPSKGGILGHTRPEDRESAFPVPVALWLGSARDDQDVLWGKAYIRDKQTAEYVRQLKAVGGKLGTSIYGTGIVKEEKNGVRRLEEFVLEQIDFAPPERASLNMGGTFAITSEMNSHLDQHKGNKMEYSALQKAVQELTDEQLMDVISDRMERIVEMYMKKKNQRPVTAEIFKAAELSRSQVIELSAQNTRLERELSATRGRIAEFERREFDIGLDAIVRDVINPKGEEARPEFAALGNSLRAQLRRLIVAELDGKRDLSAARAHAAAAAESDSFRPILEMRVRVMSGGNAVVAAAKKQAAEDLARALADNRRNSF